MQNYQSVNELDQSTKEFDHNAKEFDDSAPKCCREIDNIYFS